MKIANTIIVILILITSLIAVIGGLGIFANQQLVASFETSMLNQDIEQAQNSALLLQRGIGIIMVFSIAVALVIGFSIFRWISKPIETLRVTAIEIGNGKLGIQSNVKSKNEFGDLSNCFNKMSHKLKVNQEQLIEAERKAAIQTATWVGHDLRNPLQSMQNSTFIISKQISSLPSSSAVRQKITQVLKNIDDSIEYSERIVQNLNDFGSEQKPELTKTDINILINKTLSQIGAPENIEITEDLGQIPDINTDKNMMERVFNNLIKNAIQAVKNGGKLKVSTKKTNGFVEVIFQDTGKGMSKEIMEKIFTPFFTTKAQGMGVGLAICKKFVESNGGGITVKSEECKGSTFIVKLPI